MSSSSAILVVRSSRVNRSWKKKSGHERITFGLAAGLERASSLKISPTRVAYGWQLRFILAARKLLDVASHVSLGEPEPARGLPCRMARQGSARSEQALAPIIGTIRRPPITLRRARHDE
jgi:hypothetical protein